MPTVRGHGNGGMTTAMARGVLVCVFCALALARGAATSADAPPQVTVVGDSVSTAITAHDDVQAAVANGLRVDWHVDICRRVSELSCPFQGARPPTLVDLVPVLPAVAPIVVVELGYNDPESAFPAGLDAAMRELVDWGAAHVLWLTLHASRGPFPELNDDLRAALRRWPQLELVDWDAASADHPEWFAIDGIHLDKRGGRALARLIRAAVTRYVVPLQVVAPALPARRTFQTRLEAVGGTPPYSWRAVNALPRGLRLLADGRLVAHLPRPEPVRAAIEVEDAYGTTAVGTLR
jgi:hypothetical protein